MSELKKINETSLNLEKDIDVLKMVIDALDLVQVNGMNNLGTLFNCISKLNETQLSLIEKNKLLTITESDNTKEGE